MNDILYKKLGAEKRTDGKKECLTFLPMIDWFI